ncbi:OX-2 membrane glycoprotein-like [Rhinoderma darwinii]|uniref:OX-2 membrane glycoprotein-like n=1 Tax=Rhinoderma darwinii TaxID=43563 RepID=UPI003F67D0F9
MINIVSWNVRGITNPIKRTKIIKHLQDLKADILQETYLGPSEIKKLEGTIKVKNIATERARIDSNVTLLCQLMTPDPNVVQITWQKESGNFTGTVTTSSKVYGQKRLGYYSNRTKHFTNSSNVSAITISHVTLEDEGCFKCIFNLFPLGASSGTICLEVYEANILEPKLQVREIAHHDILDMLYVVICSATGKPAPNITWLLPENLDSAPETYTIINLNETETVISNFTLHISSIWDMKVSIICVVNHPVLSSEKRLSTVLDGTRKGKVATAGVRRNRKQVKKLETNRTERKLLDV